MSRFSGELYAPQQTSSYRARGNVRKGDQATGAPQSRLGGQAIQIARPRTSQNQHLAGLGQQAMSLYDEQQAQQQAQQWAQQQAFIQPQPQQPQQQQLVGGYTANVGGMQFKWPGVPGTPRPTNPAEDPQLVSLARGMPGGVTPENLQHARNMRSVPNYTVYGNQSPISLQKYDIGSAFREMRERNQR